jgi:hypothetical protein
MSQRIKLFSGIKQASLFLLVAGAVMPVMAAPPVAAPVAPMEQVPRSIFNIPASSKEGRDPFFPASLRPYQSVVVPGSHPTTDLSSLVIQGVLGAPPHQLVIINNVTFGVGDDAEVRTPQGRIQIHCVQISGNTAVIEANGQEHTLHYGDQP